MNQSKIFLVGNSLLGTPVQPKRRGSVQYNSVFSLHSTCGVVLFRLVSSLRGHDLADEGIQRLCYCCRSVQFLGRVHCGSFESTLSDNQLEGFRNRLSRILRHIGNSGFEWTLQLAHGRGNHLCARSEILDDLEREQITWYPAYGLRIYAYLGRRKQIHQGLAAYQAVKADTLKILGPVPQFFCQFAVTCDVELPIWNPFQPPRFNQF